MTIDERLEFLLQSTESLHGTMQEFVGGIQELKGTMNELKTTVQAVAGSVEKLALATQANSEDIGILARMAELHDPP